MVESSGNRDDLRIDSSRCLPIRFNESRCRRCVDICPHHAISIEGRLAINQENCSGCLLCTTVCPSGALEPNHEFNACLEELAKVSEPVLGCRRTSDSANAALPCLGGLSSEHLLALHHLLRLSGKTISLNLSKCSGCRNGSMLPVLQERLLNIAHEGLDSGGNRIEFVDIEGNVKVQHESINRRSFFTFIRSTLFQSAAAVIGGAAEKDWQYTGYAEKREPLRRVLLNRTINGLTTELQQLIHSCFDSRIVFLSTCTACQGCAAICPTGALLTQSREVHPHFFAESCSGCNLCVEFCLDGALNRT